jgi:adenine specific DNA methylase Mod
VYSNLLFKDDNLNVLNILKQTHKTMIKCVYLDPPYNTGIDREHFLDSKRSDEWLEMMRTRLELVKILMREDASLWISIDDSELYSLKILCDEIFGRENFLANITWQHKIEWKDYKGKFLLDHTYILAYRKTPAFEFVNNTKPKTVWLEHEVGSRKEAIAESQNLFGEQNIFSTPKPQKLIEHIIKLATNENDIILDCFSGSGTTGAAAQETGRRWIMIEIGNQCETHIIPRMNQMKSRKNSKESDYSFFPRAADYLSGVRLAENSV